MTPDQQKKVQLLLRINGMQKLSNALVVSSVDTDYIRVSNTGKKGLVNYNTHYVACKAALQAIMIVFHNARTIKFVGFEFECPYENYICKIGLHRESMKNALKGLGLQMRDHQKIPGLRRHYVDMFVKEFAQLEGSWIAEKLLQNGFIRKASQFFESSDTLIQYNDATRDGKIQTTNKSYIDVLGGDGLEVLHTEIQAGHLVKLFFTDK